MKTLFLIASLLLTSCAQNYAYLVEKDYQPEKKGVVATNWNRWGSREEASEKAKHVMAQYCSPAPFTVTSEKDISFPSQVNGYGQINYDYKPHIAFTCAPARQGASE